jgi:hypothetical protein
LKPKTLIILHFAHEVYLHIKLGNNALDRACPTEAADHFTAAVNTGTFLSKSTSDSKYDEFVVVRRHSATDNVCCAKYTICAALWV